MSMNFDTDVALMSGHSLAKAGNEVPVAHSIAIVSDGDTHIAIASGQYVYVHSHSTLAEGMYVASAAIAQNGALSSSNVSALSGGIANNVVRANSNDQWVNGNTSSTKLGIACNTQYYDAFISADSEGGNVQVRKGNGVLAEFDSAGLMNDGTGCARIFTKYPNGTDKTFQFKQDGDFVDGNGVSLDATKGRVDLVENVYPIVASTIAYLKECIKDAVDTLGTSTDTVRNVSIYTSVDGLGFTAGVEYRGFVKNIRSASGSSVYFTGQATSSYGDMVVFGYSTGTWYFRNLNLTDDTIAGSVAIICDGNTHVALSKGEYVYIKNHDTLSEGLYSVTAAVAQNGTLTSSNTTAITKGLGGRVTELNNNIGKVVAGKGATNTTTGIYTFTMPTNSHGCLMLGGYAPVTIGMTSSGVFYSTLPSVYTVTSNGNTVTVTKTSSVSSSSSISYIIVKS